MMALDDDDFMFLENQVDVREKKVFVNTKTPKKFRIRRTNDVVKELFDKNEPIIKATHKKALAELITKDLILKYLVGSLRELPYYYCRGIPKILLDCSHCKR